MSARARARRFSREYSTAREASIAPSSHLACVPSEVRGQFEKHCSKMPRNTDFRAVEGDSGVGNSSVKKVLAGSSSRWL